MPITNNVILANSSGSVGIGTYTPTQKLDVIGNTYVSGRLSVATTSTAGTGITVGGSTVLLSFAEIQQGNVIYFYNSGNTTNTMLSQNATGFYINATGNVGISTAAATLAKLQVQGNVWAQSFTGSFSGSITAPGSNTQIIYNSSGVLAGSNNFIFDGTNIGIGTTTPFQKLQINEALRSEYFGTDSSFPADAMNIVGTGAFRGLGTGSALLFSVPANIDGTNIWAQARILGTADNGSNGNAEGAMFLQTRALYNPGVGGTWNWRTNMVLRASGNIGIGTNNPILAKLQVQGNVWAQSFTGSFSGSITTSIGSNTNVIYNNAGVLAGSNNFIFDGTNVGIGTTSPIYKLQTSGISNFGDGSFVISGPTNSTSYYDQSTGAYFHTPTMMIRRDQASTSVTEMSASFVLYNKNGTDNTGNKLVFAANETTATNANPVATAAIISQKISGIAGGWAVGNLKFLVKSSSTYVDVMTMLSSGNVGIGTTIPANKLHVESSNEYIRISNLSSGDGGIKISYQNSDIAGLHLTYNPGSALSYIDNTYPVTSGQVYGDIYFRQNVGGTMTTRMMIKADGGNIGIATTNPSLAKLQVQGNVWAQSFTGSFSGSSAAPGSNTNVVYNNAGVLAGSNNFVFNGTNVGIGTTSPTAQLHLSGAANIKTTNSANTSGFDIGLLGGAADPGGYIYQRANSYIIFGTNNSQKMLLDANGNLGIGVTSPLARLHTGINLSDYSSQTFTNTGAIITSIGVDHTASRTNVLSLMRDGTSGIVYAGLAAFDISRWSADGVNARTQLDIRLADTDTATITDVLSLRSSGNVGIGTTSPATGKVQINTGAASNNAITIQATSQTAITYGIGIDASSNFAIYDNFNSAQRVTINGSGNVGIGTTSPASKLDIVGGSISAGTNSATEGTIILQDQYGTLGHLTNIGTNRSSGGVVLGYGVYPSGVTSNAFISSTTIALERAAFSFDSNFRWYTGDSQTVNTGSAATLTQKMVLANNGNLGIGTTNPNQNVHVFGTAPTIFVESSNNTGGQFRAKNTLSEYIKGIEGSTTGGWMDYDVINSQYITLYRTGSTGFYTIYTNGGERIRVDGGSGNVGIGTISPSVKLDINIGVAKTDTTLYGYGSLILRSNESSNYSNLGINFIGGATQASRGFQFQTGELGVSNLGNILLQPYGGSIGIGTTNPLQKLDLQGDGVRLRLSTAGAPSTYYFDIESNYDSANTINFYGTAGNNFLKYIYNDNQLLLHPGGGKVGIGTASATGSLQVHGTLSISNNAVIGQGSIYGTSTAGSFSTLKLYDSSTGNTDLNNQTYNIQLQTAGSTKLFIKNDGNIGIGTTSPNTTLQVVGNVRVGAINGTTANHTIDLTAGGSGGNAYVDFGYYGTFDAAIWLVGYWGADGSGQFKIKDAGSGTPTDRFVISQGTGATTITNLAGTGDRIVGANSSGLLSSITVGSGLSLSGGTLTATGGSAGTVTGTGASTQVSYWTSASNITGSNGFVYDNANVRVGIGTTVPAFKLDVIGDITANGGNVRSGYGLSTGDAYVDIGANRSSNGYAYIDLIGDTTYTDYGFRFIRGNTGINTNSAINHRGTGPLQIISVDAGSIELHTSNTVRTTITSDGNVGIGTTSPGANLQIGNANISTSEMLRLSVNYAGGADSRGVISWHDTTNLTGQIDTRFDGAKVNMHFGSLYNSGYNSTVRMTILGDGNVGIGTTSPIYKLDVHGGGATIRALSNTTYTDIALTNTSTTSYIQASTTNMYFYVAGGSSSDVVLSLDGTNNNVGIGTTTPLSKLQLVNNVSGGGFSSFGSYQILLWTTGTAANSYGMGIESETFMFNSDVNYKFYVDNVAKVRFDSSGTITAAGDLVAYGSPSDITLKTNIKPLEGALEKITKLQGVSFTWKDSEQTKMTGLKDDIGFIAQEVQEILPELVRKNDNGLLSLRDKGIIPYLVEAVKEQQKQIDELRYLLQNK